MMNRYVAFICALLLAPTINYAASLSGVVRNPQGEILPYVTISIYSGEDKLKGRSISTDIGGKYSFSDIDNGDYTVESTFIGFKSVKHKLSVTENKAYKVNFKIAMESKQIDKVVVEGRATRAEQKGDSLIYNATAFKVMDGSSAEDLLAKMPGIVVEGGEVQAQGESVQKVLVDGKEFFDGDINVAIKNIPSDVISSIEVFDKKSEQAEFSGFDDGEQIKTINIVTKSGYTEGKFGELYAGYGTDERYKVGGNVNLFNDDQRISILGMSNNINQQNFSQEDLAGVMSASTQRRGRGGNSSSSFMVGSQSGVTQSDAVGVNYVDQWGEKVKFTGSYFYNNSYNFTETDKVREYFETSMEGMSYKEFSESRMNNWNHRINSKIDYTINQYNTLSIIPTFSFQDNITNSIDTGENYYDDILSDQVIEESDIRNRVYSAGGEVIFRHRFPKVGRTMSLSVNGTYSNTDKDDYSDYITAVSGGSSDIDNQYTSNLKESYSVRGTLMYTEALSRWVMLMSNYRVSLSDSSSDKSVWHKNTPEADLYENFDEDLSNRYTSDYLTQSGGLSMNYNRRSWMINVGGDVQYATLDGAQTMPSIEDIDRDYVNFLPNLFARYTINRSNSLMLRYRSSTSSPSITDLQSVIDNSNPLFMSSGNPELDQQVNHTASLRYMNTSTSGTTFIAMMGATVRDNYVADSTVVATQAIQISDEVTLEKGAQYTKPINMSGYYSLQSLFTYGFPFDFIHSNVNLSVAANYSNEPNVFNGIASYTRDLSVTPKVVIGSNISEKLDFTLSYSASMSYALSSENNSSSTDFTTHSTGAKLGWVVWRGYTLRSSLSYISYSGVDMDDPNYYLWGASLGKKFLKNDWGELLIEAYDILHENRSFSQSVGSTYYQYTTTNVLDSYVMLTFTYKFR